MKNRDNMSKLTKLLNNWSGTALELFGELNFLTHWKKEFEELETKEEEYLEGQEEDCSLLGVSKDKEFHAPLLLAYQALGGRFEQRLTAQW